MSTGRFHLRLATLTSFVILALFTLPAYCSSASGPRSVRCTTWQTLNAGSSAVQTAGEGTIACFRIPVTEAGILVLHAWETGQDSGPVELILPRTSEQEGPQAEFSLLFQASSDGVLHIRRAGDLYIAVRAKDPQQPLRGFLLRTRFEAEPTIPTGQQLWLRDAPASCSASDLPTWSPEPLAGTAFWESTGNVEPDDCDIISGSITVPGAVVIRGEGAALAAALYKGTQCNYHNLVAEGRLGSGGSMLAALASTGEYRLVLDNREPRSANYDLTVKHFDLCTAEAGGESNDLPLCAPPLLSGVVTTGLIASGEVPDEDFFRLDLAELTSVEIEVISAAPLTCTVLDQAGRRVVPVSSCGAGAATLTKVLTGGKYSLRIAGNSGAYSVRWQPRSH